MNRVLLAASIAFLPTVFSGCGSTPKPAEEEGGWHKKHTGEFLWEQARAAIQRRWRVESEDAAAREIVTAWDEQLAPMNTFGRRHRLTVTMEGDATKGHRLKVKQDTEQNTNQENPLSREEADWEPASSDGALAMQFLLDVERRLNPPNPLREHELR